jgi:hypothetical protein
VDKNEIVSETTDKYNKAPKVSHATVRDAVTSLESAREQRIWQREVSITATPVAAPVKRQKVTPTSAEIDKPTPICCGITNKRLNQLASDSDEIHRKCCRFWSWDAKTQF